MNTDCYSCPSVSIRGLNGFGGGKVAGEPRREVLVNEKPQEL
jgi:hypothetical protein